MPPRGVKKGSKRARQYEHVRKSERDQGASEKRAEEIAARTVNKERARSGESQTALAQLDRGHLLGASRRAALGQIRPARAHARAALRGGRSLGVEGRSSMSKAQLRRAVDAKKR